MDSDPALRQDQSPAGRRLPSGDLAVVAAFVVVAALLAPFSVEGDGTFYYDLTRRLVGDGGVVYAYQWGTSLWNAPVYLVWHALGLPAAVSPPHAQGDPFQDASITIAASVAAVGAVLVARRVVDRLGLPCNAVLLIGTLLGTQLWFFGVFMPSQSHALDALAFSVACYLVVRVWQGAPSWAAAGLGAALVALVTIRYANLAALPGFLLPVILRRERRAIANLVVGALVGTALLLLPLLVRGIGFGTSADVRRSEAGTSVFGLQDAADPLGRTLIPLKMLLSPDRGLFVYAPLCAVALVGFVLAILRPTPARVPLVSIGTAALGILLVHIAIGSDWRGGGYTYGQRFLTSLAAGTLIGLAELYRRAPRMTAVTVVLCTAWSLFIGFNFAYGWEGVTNDTRNADDIVRLYVSGERTLPDLARVVAYRLRERFTG